MTKIDPTFLILQKRHTRRKVFIAVNQARNRAASIKRICIRNTGSYYYIHWDDMHANLAASVSSFTLVSSKFKEESLRRTAISPLCPDLVGGWFLMLSVLKFTAAQHRDRNRTISWVDIS